MEFYHEIFLILYYFLMNIYKIKLIIVDECLLYNVCSTFKILILRLFGL